MDPEGRITLPQEILNALGLQPEKEVIIELTEGALIIRPKDSITSRIAAMNLPVSDWEIMEQEI
ncbi:MAG: AbrB/MazE/SpoVT family DNA-binding domain-containing protein [Anaerolineae bacterium]